MRGGGREAAWVDCSVRHPKIVERKCVHTQAGCEKRAVWTTDPRLVRVAAVLSASPESSRFGHEVPLR